MNKAPRILISPLDWGLGHATRCIPLIKDLLENGCEVLIAGSLTTNSLLKQEFPSIQFLELQGYNVQYSINKKNLAWVIFKQIPKIISRIIQEHFWLKRQIQIHRIDAVISDNRFGLFSSEIPSVFVTHQLQIQVPQSKILETWVKILNKWFILKYKYCWIVDYQNEPMAGKLSNNDFVPNATYLGNCSRFERMKIESSKYEILVILSGPEPQRSIFEKKILQTDIKKKLLLVQGKPSENTQTKSLTPYIDTVSHLNSTELMKLIQSIPYVLNRCGYTSVMDMIKLEKNVIYVPTPGQTEQEYLASYIEDKKWGIACNQEEFNLQNLIDKFDASHFEKFPAYNLNLHQEVISDFVKDLKDSEV